MTKHKQTIAKQWRNFRDCPKCGAAKGSACRSPACVQLQEAPQEVHDIVETTVQLERPLEEVIKRQTVTTL